MILQPSTLTTVAVAIIKALAAYSCDGNVLLRRAGLDAGLLNDPNARYPVAGMTRFWQLAVEATGDPCFGLVVPHFIQPTTFHALGFSWLASATLKEGLERFARYHRIVSSGAEVRLEETCQDYRLHLRSPGNRPTPAAAAIDCGMAITLGICRTMYRQDFAPLGVDMSRPEPADTAPFMDFFRAPLRFAAPENRFYFDKAELEVALPTGNEELARSNDKVALDYLMRFDRSNICARVRASLIEQLPAGEPTQVAVAKALHISLRHLQRRLREEGTTYRDLLEETRRELAMQYIRQSRFSVVEISYLLGFANPGNFSRAFRRWTGTTPSEYRQLN